MDKFKIFLSCILLTVLLSFCGSPQKATSTGAEVVDSSDKEVAVQPTSPAVKTKVATTDPAEEKIQLQKKYSVYLGTKPETITNIKLYRFIDEWLNTKYKWGGDDKNGIDCSAFVRRLLDNVYNIYIPRVAEDQFFDKWIDRFASTKHLAEGDLLFFKTLKGKGITHVGLYLDNGKFINSSGAGVSFGDLNSPHWKPKFVAAGRIKQSMVTKVRN